jgi:hypothetical protein
MREIRKGDFLLRDYLIPVVVEPVHWMNEEDKFDPHIETQQVREIVYIGNYWPTPDEVATAIDQFRGFFYHAPDRVVIPQLHGSKFRGIEMLHG